MEIFLKMLQLLIILFKRAQNVNNLKKLFTLFLTSNGSFRLVTLMMVFKHIYNGLFFFRSKTSTKHLSYH